MEIVEVKCESCGKTMYVFDEYIREKMYCTIGCLETGKNSGNMG